MINKHETLEKQMSDCFQFLRRTIISIASSYHFNNDENDDILQNVLMSVYLNYQKYTEHGAFFSWVAKITNNKCRDLIRRKKSFMDAIREYEYFEMTMPFEHLDPRLIQRAILDEYKREIATYDPTKIETKVLEAYFVLDTPKSVIARELGISRKTVYRIITDSINKLKKKYIAYLDKFMS